MHGSEPQGHVLVSHPATGVALVEINRPSARNAMNAATVAALGQTLTTLDTDPGIRAVVLAGVGGDLSAGRDMRGMRGRGMGCLGDAGGRRGGAQMEALGVPMMGGGDGMALGAGLELALLADWIVVGPDARLGLPELTLGVMPGDGGTQRLARAIGQGPALRLILTGEIFDAGRAAALGLADAAPGGARADAIGQAARIAAMAPLAARMAKRTVRAGLEAPLATGLALEARGLELLFATADQREGMAAFVEKRRARFEGR